MRAKPALSNRLDPDRWYADRDMAIEAALHQSMFNVIDLETGWKVDIILRKGRAFSREEFSRRVRGSAAGVEAWLASAEDVLLAKLEWASRGGSERQLRDAAGIVAVRGDQLDLAYIDRWAADLGVSDLWARIRPPRS